jgi:hypothetical protein
MTHLFTLASKWYSSFKQFLLLITCLLPTSAPSWFRHFHLFQFKAQVSSVEIYCFFNCFETFLEDQTSLCCWDHHAQKGCYFVTILRHIYQILFARDEVATKSKIVSLYFRLRHYVQLTFGVLTLLFSIKTSLIFCLVKKPIL